ncbi:MAG: HPF/RaiA family ribosome-associated protein [Bacteroidia bacterium]
MKIQINSDKNIACDIAHNQWLKETIQSSLLQFKEKITRIEVHLSDENAGKAGKDDKRCMIEARPEGLQPLAVTGNSETIDQAVLDALTKMENALTSLYGRKDERVKMDLQID